jgi:undecaprenyl diphosphate synthase
VVSEPSGDRGERAAALPRHIAVIMDGNGRWARARGLPRPAGHKAGIAPVRMTIEQCGQRGIGALTLFAFSSENWRRPREEVSSLIGLFLDALDREVAELHEKGVRLRFIGDRGRLSAQLVTRMEAAEALTVANSGLALQVAVSYGGRWDLVQAARTIAARCARGDLAPDAIEEETVGAALELGALCDPDLFIRTGGERRISNFLLWNLAYTELYFTECLWPEFDVAELEAALAHFARRERRFGLTSGQLVDTAQRA